jgi:ABC-2 type transport system permease protein
MNQRMLRVAEREYLAYVRTKTFVIGILTLPLIFALFIGLPALMESMPKPPRPFTILDETGRYADRVVATLRERASGPGGVLSIEMRDHLYVPPEQLNLPSGTAERMEALQRQAMAGSLFAYFVISANDDQGTYRLAYYSTDPSAARLPQILRGILDESIRTENLRPFIDDEETLLRALRGVTFETHAITKEGEEVATAAHMARAYAPMAFVYLLWITILTMSSHLMTSTIEEKSSRIVEVLLSSVSPLEFISGKLGGLAAAGITMIVAWIATIALVSVAIPSVVVRQILTGLGSAFGGANIFWFLAFFLLGFLFYAVLYIGLGSVCNTLREAQNLLQPVMIVMMLPLALMAFMTNNPDHPVAVFGSFFPPFTPFLMMNRIPAQPPPPLWQILLAALIMILSTWVMIRAAAKVFRLGILLYGKPPTLPEVLRWARQKG